MVDRIVIDVDRDGWTNGLQLNIAKLDENGRGWGYRLHGPKYNGSSENLLRHELTERDAAEIREALDAAFPQPPQPSRAEVLDEAIGMLNSMWSLAPSTHRASGINFAIGVLMGLRDEATPASAPIESAGDETGEAPHRFEKEYQGESDAKRRLARCKHCHGSRDDDVHTTGGVS